jgi:RNA polymerase sigma factor (sigma-70 family)
VSQFSVYPLSKKLKKKFSNMKRIYSSEKPNFGAEQAEIKTYIEQLRQGDETVWLVIYGQNLQPFLNYVHKLGKISDTEAEILVQKAYGKFLKIIKAEELKNHKDLKSYFFTMLHHKMMSFLKKPSKQVEYGNDDWLARIKDEDDSAIQVEKEAVFKLIDNALPSLRPKYKEVIHLRYYTKPPMDFEAIAVQLGITDVNARKIHERAKAQIRDFILKFIPQTQ